MRTRTRVWAGPVARRFAAASLVAAAGIAALMILVVPAIQHRLTCGTFSTEGPPPRVDYCGRRYYPATATEPRAAVDALLAQNGESGLTVIATAPLGMRILANVMSPATKAHYHTDVCTMAVYVQTGPDSYLAYGLSGGP